MKISEIVDLLQANIHYIPHDLQDADLTTATACDLMSDILASHHPPDILITSLNNPQAIRTCSVFGIKMIVVARGRQVENKLLELAKEEGIALISTKDSLFIVSGKLYAKGIVDVM